MQRNSATPAEEIPSSAEDRQVFWDTANPAGYANRSGHYKTQVEREFIRAHFPAPPARVLDIAGGSGRFAVPLLRAGYDVTVNDIHPPSLRRLLERCGEPKPEVVPGDFLKTAVPGTFDCALAIECLDWMPFRETLLRIRELLKPGGVFVYTVLNSGSWRFVARRLLGRSQRGEHVMRTKEYRDACDQSGFDIVGMRGLMWMPFAVTSNSPFVPLCAKLERFSKAYTFYSQSPWLLMAVRRRP